MAMSAEHRSNFAALHRQWWRLFMSEKFSSGTNTPNKQTDSMAETLSNQAISLLVMHMRDYQFIIYKKIWIFHT